jgi:hypothetical protein
MNVPILSIQVFSDTYVEDPVFISHCAKKVVDKVEEADKRKSQKERQTNMLNMFGRVMQV